MNGEILLTFNPGSSTIKLGLFAIEANRPCRLGSGIIDLRHRPLALHVIEGIVATDISLKATVTDDLHEVIDETLSWLRRHFSVNTLAAVGHRVVHGGDRFAGPEAISDAMLDAVEALVPLAPLHQPQSIRLIRAVRHLRPGLPQIASFDTAFHRSQSDLVRRFALPRTLFDQGVKRYGFHGLSYRFIAGQLQQIAPDVASGRVVAAHLGSGASLCALEAGISRDTSMGFSTLDGIPMATRCGALDPGVLIHLVKQRGLSIDAIEDMLYHRSGLLGTSGISADSRDLIASDAPEAQEALDLFTLRIAREIAALATTLRGLDGIVFTGGIGEHQPQIRNAICRHLAWLGVAVDDSANSDNATRIDGSRSKIAVLVIPTDEEQIIADETCSILAAKEPIG
ncbi:MULTISPECIES: acetate/propionate family kinase [unclassified Bradyrhizobium]|uniref:acetate/propionate family kinase n=1 Tax=unclassified Bradyrhizobium TaxID=2631580 RepID=UPI001BABF22F|nr:MULTISPECIES: acetate/propionate family kinase [unclassified Bradyrhizobium]MBR1205172.1 acetate/propionate family kinase [Bradyrhizobium sp. AUGA SZCCT0124]MBR1312251.1 acetate/propionate family kinase [Bradyrhizobium sp. AUGA SZCCT0051]MBR1342142.1 acetate/propionate family kinase [Bradyrhizobium sp. AUGA SZCCT0105]MBR1358933.1 acetate/propionate family kinase [Bradyrhizobium sp. AUGA SZCCT0045]